MKLIFGKKSLIPVVFILFLLLCLGFFLRANYLFPGDFYFLPDQARDLLLVKDMIETHKPSLIGGRAMSGGYVFHGPFWIWFLAIPFILFKGNLLSFAYTYVGISLAIIAGGYIVSYLLYGLRTAIFAGLFLTVSGILVANVSGTTNAQIMPLVFIGFLYFFIRYLRGNVKSFYLAAFFAGLGVQFQGIFAVPLFLYLLLVSIFTDRYVFHIKRAIIAVLAFVIPLFTFFLFDIRHDFLMAKGIVNLLTDRKGLGVIPGYEQYENIGFRIVDRIKGFFSLPYSIMLANSLPLYILLYGSLIGSFFMLRKSKLHQEKKEMLTLFILPAFLYVVYLYFSYPVWEHYVYSFAVVAAFLFAIALNKIWNYLPGKIIGILILGIISISVFQRLERDYFPLQNTVSQSDGSYHNQLAVVDYIFKDAAGVPFGYFVSTPQVFTYGMDYLMWWRGKYTYSYLPEAKKLPVFYLIMYPPLSGDTGAHAFWIKNVIRTNSKLVERKVFPGNIIVEKRQTDPTKEAPVDPNYYLNVR